VLSIASPMGILAQQNDTTSITKEVTKEQFLEAVDRVHTLRVEQHQLQQTIDAGNSTDAEKSRVIEIDSELVPDMKILDKYEEQRKALYYIEPEQKKYLESIELSVRQQVAELAKEVGITEYAVNLNSLTRTIEIVTNDESYNDRVQKIISQYPTDVPFDLQNGSFTNEACPTRTSDCDPIVGGIQIIDQSPGGACSLGLPVKKSLIEYGFITAGHCAEDNDKLYQPANTASQYQIGDSADSRYESTCDCAYIKKTTWTTSHSWVLRDPNLYLVITSEATSRPSMGTQVVLFGVGSGFKQGEVTNPNYTYTADGINWNLVDTNISTTGGDSGAPYTNAAANKILGIHKANAGIFSPWNEVDSRFNVSLH
jgi:hypothetical protein